MIQREEVGAIGEFTLVEKVDRTSDGKQPAGYEILNSAGNVEVAFGPGEKDAASRALHDLALRHGYHLNAIASDGDCSVWEREVDGHTTYVVRVGNDTRIFSSSDEAVGFFRSQLERHQPDGGNAPGF